MSHELTLADVQAVQPVANTYIREMADHHRVGEASCSQKIADARRAFTQASEIIDVRVEAEERRHREELDRLEGLREKAKENCATVVDANERELLYHRAALVALPRD